MPQIRNYACRTINKTARRQARLAKHHLGRLLHRQPVFSGHHLQPSSLRLVRYLGVVLLAHLEPPRPNLPRAHLEPLGNNHLPQAPVLAPASLEVLRLANLNSNPLHLGPWVSLNSNNNNNRQPQALVLVSLVIQAHSGNQSLLQDSGAPLVNQVGPQS